MPAPVVAALAKRAGVSAKEAERIWKKIKDAVIGAKLKGGGTIGGNFDKWGSTEWAYTMGAFKKALKLESVIDIIDLYLAGHPVDSLLIGSDLRTFFDEEGELRFSSSDGVLLNPTTPLMKDIKLASEQASADSGIVELLSDYEGSLQDLYDKVFANFTLDEQSTGPVRTARRPRKRRFARLGKGFSAITGKRKDPAIRLVMRRAARKGRAKRKMAARRFSHTAQGKSFHKKLGKLVARIRKH
jgi:hypothetical protein